MKPITKKVHETWDRIVHQQPAKITSGCQNNPHLPTDVHVLGHVPNQSLLIHSKPHSYNWLSYQLQSEIFLFFISEILKSSELIYLISYTVHAFITSCSDYCNSLLIGLSSKCQLFITSTMFRIELTNTLNSLQSLFDSYKNSPLLTQTINKLSDPL